MLTCSIHETLFMKPQLIVPLSLFQVAHMSKSEMSNLDVTLFVPLAFFANAKLSFGIPEHLILLLSLVSKYLKIKVSLK